VNILKLVKEFGMSNWIWWYIWILVESYLEAGLIIALIFIMINYIFPSDQIFTLKDYFIIIFLHPIVIYHFIKEYYGNR
jgi:hypothetical protein